MPHGWKEYSLGDLIEIKHGFAFLGEYFKDDPQGDILLTPGNFSIAGGFKDDKFKYYVGPVPQEFVLDERDLLITMTDLSKEADTLGYPAIIPKPSCGRFLHNQRLGKVLIKNGARLNKGFLYQLLKTNDYRHEVLASATGTTVKHTSPNRILAFKFKLPPPYEQQAIAHILGTLDDKIELNRRMNETLEAMARALFKSWFVDFDPVRAKAEGRQPEGMDADTASLFPDSFEDSPMGKIPKGWRVGSLGEIAGIGMGQSPPGETYNEVGEGLPFYQGIRDFGWRFPSRRVYCTQPTRFAEMGDVLLSVRAPVGSLNIALESCAIGRGLAALRLKPSHGSFLLYLLKSDDAIWEKFEAKGTVFGAATKGDIHSIEVIQPSHSQIIQAFNKIVGSFDARIEAIEDESHTLAAIRDTLLPKLLSGEVRIRDAEKWLEAPR